MLSRELHRGGAGASRKTGIVRVRGAMLLMFVVAAVGSCREVPLLAPFPGAEAAAPTASVRADIVEGAPEADGLLTFAVRVRSRDLSLSAFQGVLTFAPGAFELVSMSTPQRGGETYLFNPEEFSAGRVRFAALSPTTFADALAGDGVEALRVTVRPLRPIDEANLSATLDVAGRESGASIDAARLLPSQLVRSGGTSRGK
jgi:hypothetical protein